MTGRDMEDLQSAKGLLENISFAAKVASAIGRPLEKGSEFLPVGFSDVLGRATKSALLRALDFAVRTMDDHRRRTSSDLLHKIAVIASGAGGGAFGLAGLPVELPVSTAIMLRSIADIARSQGENIRLPETKLACMEIFAIGSRSGTDEGTDVGYFAVRAALARSLSEAAQHIAERGLINPGAPAIIRFINQVASRFGVTVSEKLAAQTIPIAGAAGAAMLNLLFLDHYQNTARGHFIVRRLERSYLPETVRKVYDNLQVT